MARLVLVGLPGVGKSTVARDVAGRWGCAALDTDSLVAREVGRPAGAYLRQAGEELFRRRELAALVRALTLDAVVSTGGGVVTTQAGRDALRGQPVIWLDGADEVIVARLDDEERPLLGANPGAALADLRRAREGWYREVAIARVDVAGAPEEVARRVIDAVEVSA